MIRLLLISSLFSLTLGCATGDYDSGLMPRLDENANPNPHAIAVDAFNVRKPMPLGQKTSSDFFFTRCEQNNQGTFYSRTSYDCGTSR